MDEMSSSDKVGVNMIYYCLSTYIRIFVIDKSILLYINVYTSLQAFLRKLQQANMLFVVPPYINDDWFWIFASLKNQTGPSLTQSLYPSPTPPPPTTTSATSTITTTTTDSSNRSSSGSGSEVNYARTAHGWVPAASGVFTLGSEQSSQIAKEIG